MSTDNGYNTYNGDRVRKMRQSKGISQSELADRLGVTQSRISQIESSPQCTGSLMETVFDAMGEDFIPDESQIEQIRFQLTNKVKRINNEHYLNVLNELAEIILNTRN